MGKNCKTDAWSCDTVSARSDMMKTEMKIGLPDMIKTEMKIGLLIGLILACILNMLSATNMRCGICPSSGGVADCKQIYQSCIRIIEKADEPTREILVARCGQLVMGTITPNLKFLTSVNGERCYGKF